MKKKLIKVLFILLFLFGLFDGLHIYAAEDTMQQQLASKIKEVSVNNKAITLTMFSESYVDGFVVYRSTNQYSGFKYLATVQSEYYFSDDNWYRGGTYTDKKVEYGTRYYYKVKAFYQYYDNTKVYGALSKAKSGVPKLKTPEIIEVKRMGIRSLQIKWNKVYGSDGYEIYRSGNQYKNFKKIKDCTNSNTLRFLDEKRTCGTKYYYKIRAYKNVNGKKIYSTYSNKKSGIPAPAKAMKPTVTIQDVSTVQVTIQPVADAHGYELYRTQSNGKFVKARTLTENLTTTITGLKNGVFYGYKVRAYRLVKGKKVYGEFSNIRTRVMDVLGYELESFESRYNRAFAGGESWFGNRTLAEANMINITVNVWDFDGTGNKVTKQKTFPVNQYLADTIKQIFKEIYEGKERFPIHSVGCYSWRGDNSSSEHCNGTALDINPNENCMMDGDTVVSGSYWKPYEDPYSIPLDGEVAQIFAKYGFTQGLWGYRNDYMHFSYFGT